MKKILPLLFFLLSLYTFYLILNTTSVLAQIRPPFGGGLGSKVSAKVGDFYLNLSGYVSPFSSIILTSDGVFIRATTADQYGNFSISEVLIKSGFSKFCLKAVDFKHLGESETCFSVPPAKGSITMRDIFLPPTLALSKNKIGEGESTIAYGYTMPGALVTLYLSDGRKLTTTADSTGYYKFTLDNLKAGKYTLYSRANYKGIDSLSPSKKLEVYVLSWWEQFIEYLRNLLNKLISLFTSWSLGILWLVIPIIILIIILILKLWPRQTWLWPGRFTWITRIPVLPFVFDFLTRKKNPLHHKWMVGY